MNEAMRRVKRLEAEREARIRGADDLDEAMLHLRGQDFQKWFADRLEELAPEARVRVEELLALAMSRPDAGEASCEDQPDRI